MPEILPVVLATPRLTATPRPSQLERESKSLEPRQHTPRPPDAIPENPPSPPPPIPPIRGFGDPPLAAAVAAEENRRCPMVAPELLLLLLPALLPWPDSAAEISGRDWKYLAWPKKHQRPRQHRENNREAHSSSREKKASFSLSWRFAKTMGIGEESRIQSRHHPRRSIDMNKRGNFFYRQ